MATTYKTVDVWVVVDEDGDYDCGVDAGLAAENYANNIMTPDGTKGMRVVKLSVRVPLPTPIELTGEVVSDESGAGLVVA